ncbi:MAG: CbiX/SirB N-terminal domain-containing protein, partial [Chthoniobacterales bacterium]
KIHALNHYATVLNVYMEEPPFVSDWAKLTNTPNVVVVPFFIADGLHSYQDIPVLLGIEKGKAPAASQRRENDELFSANPHKIGGRALHYAPSLGTDARFANLIVEQAAAFSSPRQSSQPES